jgi:hypothetical protein
LSSGEANSSEIRRLVLCGSFIQTVGGVAGKLRGSPFGLLGVDCPETRCYSVNPSTTTVIVNYSIDIVLLMPMSPPLPTDPAIDTTTIGEKHDDFRLITLPSTFQAGAKRICHLAVAYTYFESPEFIDLVYRFQNASSGQPPRYGRFLWLLSRFTGLETLELVIGLPKTRPLANDDGQAVEDRYLNRDDLEYEEISLSEWGNAPNPPKHFMQRFQETFFPENADKEIAWTTLQQDVQAFLGAGKDGRWDTHHWKGSNWNVPNVSFKWLELEGVLKGRVEVEEPTAVEGQGAAENQD